MTELALEGGKEFGSKHFLERREAGIINIGGPGAVEIDGDRHALNKGDGLYVGMGPKKITFSSDDAARPAQFYLVSSPAHREYPTVKIEQTRANPRRLGKPETVNVRTIYQYVHPAVCASCQLAFCNAFRLASPSGNVLIQSIAACGSDCERLFAIW